MKPARLGLPTQRATEVGPPDSPKSIQPPSVELKISQLEKNTAHAFMRAMFPNDGAMTHSMSDATTDRFFAELLEAAPLKTQLGLRLALVFLAFAPILFLSRARMFTNLGRTEQTDLLAVLLSHRIYLVRQLLLLLKAMGALAFANLADVRAAMLPTEIPTPAHSGARIVGSARRLPVLTEDEDDDVDVA